MEAGTGDSHPPLAHPKDRNYCDGLHFACCGTNRHASSFRMLGNSYSKPTALGICGWAATFSVRNLLRHACVCRNCSPAQALEQSGVYILTGQASSQTSLCYTFDSSCICAHVLSFVSAIKLLRVDMLIFLALCPATRRHNAPLALQQVASDTAPAASLATMRKRVAACLQQPCLHRLEGCGIPYLAVLHSFRQLCLPRLRAWAAFEQVQIC